MFVGTLAADGADAIPGGSVHRSEAGQKPFEYAFSPDGSRLVVWFEDTHEISLVDPTTGTPIVEPWGAVTDPPSRQRR